MGYFFHEADVPVSYTHLDVYKRQADCLFTSFGRGSESKENMYYRGRFIGLSGYVRKAWGFRFFFGMSFSIPVFAEDYGMHNYESSQQKPVSYTHLSC